MAAPFGGGHLFLECNIADLAIMADAGFVSDCQIVV